MVDPRRYMTYQPFLPEAAAGSLEPRHVVVPLRTALSDCRGDHRRGRQARPTRDKRGPDRAGRGRAVRAWPTTCSSWPPGSVARTLPIPGLAEHGIGFKNVEEAIDLRNQVLDRLDVGQSTTDDPRCGSGR